MADQSIIIIGAGAAGLMAAKELCETNRVIILEAASRLGGRVHTVEGEGFMQPVEAGAEFVHGKLPLTLELLKEANIKHEKTGGEMYRFNNGKWKEDHEQTDGWDELMEKMQQLEHDITLLEFLERYYSDEKFAKLRAQVRGYAEGYDVADINKVSVMALRNEWQQEGEGQYRIPGGYIKLINHLAEICKKNGCEIYTNSIVKQIDWVANEVTVYTADGKKYTASKVVVTVPIIMLQKALAKASINFIPSLDEYVRAANDIGYGDVVKVILQFKNAFWHMHKSKMGFILSDEWMPVWWTQAPADAATLTGWLGGPKATALTGTSDETILQKSIDSLCSIFSMTKEELITELVTAKVFNWAINDFSMGAYSYATPDTIKALKLLKMPVDGTVFFAGEAIYDGPHPGTVESALVSGKEVAEKIKAIATK